MRRWRGVSVSISRRSWIRYQPCICLPTLGNRWSFSGIGSSPVNGNKVFYKFAKLFFVAVILTKSTLSWTDLSTTNLICDFFDPSFITRLLLFQSGLLLFFELGLCFLRWVSLSPFQVFDPLFKLCIVYNKAWLWWQRRLLIRFHNYFTCPNLSLLLQQLLRVCVFLLEFDGAVFLASQKLLKVSDAHHQVFALLCSSIERLFRLSQVSIGFGLGALPTPLGPGQFLNLLRQKKPGIEFTGTFWSEIP